MRESALEVVSVAVTVSVLNKCVTCQIGDLGTYIGVRDLSEYFLFTQSLSFRCGRIDLHFSSFMSDCSQRTRS
jgi:hypothetical protein